MNKKHAIGYSATALVALLFGVGIGGSGQDTGTTTGGKPATTQTVAGPETVTTVTATKTVTKTVTVAPKPSSVVGEGTWEVGVDIKTGTYKVITPITDNCYWEISKIGATGLDAIIANANPTGGRPVVVLRSGQEFTNHGCGDWGKIK